MVDAVAPNQYAAGGPYEQLDAFVGALSTFGAGSGALVGQGNISRQISSAGVSPGATGADNVLAVFSIPASSFDVAGRALSIMAAGSFAANGNTKQLKIIVNPATAVVGSTVGASGVTVADTGAVATNGLGWVLNAEIIKYGAAGSNTQLGYGSTQAGTAMAATKTAAIAAVESGAILVAICGNATTTASDIVFNILEVNAKN